MFSFYRYCQILFQHRSTSSRSPQPRVGGLASPKQWPGPAHRDSQELCTHMVLSSASSDMKWHLAVSHVGIIYTIETGRHCQTGLLPLWRVSLDINHWSLLQSFAALVFPVFLCAAAPWVCHTTSRDFNGPIPLTNDAQSTCVCLLAITLVSTFVRCLFTLSCKNFFICYGRIAVG